MLCQKLEALFRLAIVWVFLSVDTITHPCFLVLRATVGAT